MLPTRSIILRSEIHILINFVWQGKELFGGGAYLCFIVIWEVVTQIITIIINTYYLYQISTAFQPIILNEKLTAYVDWVTGFHQCGFRHTRSIAIQKCFYLQTQGDKLECSGIMFYS